MAVTADYGKGRKWILSALLFAGNFDLTETLMTGGLLLSQAFATLITMIGVMASKMKWKIIEKQIASYRRCHKGSDFGDTERGKVERDILQGKKAQKLVERAAPNGHADITDEDLDSYENALHVEKKAHGNAKTHQERYKRFSQHDDFG